MLFESVHKCILQTLGQTVKKLKGKKRKKYNQYANTGEKIQPYEMLS